MHHKTDSQIFVDIELPTLHSRVEQYKKDAWRFVNICGSTVEGGVELIYTFVQGEPMDNLRLVIPNGTHVPSISDLYLNSFYFENETHDLFGVQFDGIAIDFGGEFYTVSVPTPMNPASVQAKEAIASNSFGAANYGACSVPGAAGAAKIAPSPDTDDTSDPRDGSDVSNAREASNSNGIRETNNTSEEA